MSETINKIKADPRRYHMRAICDMSTLKWHAIVRDREGEVWRGPPREYAWDALYAAEMMVGPIEVVH